jgi:hypothetical protein
MATKEVKSDLRDVHPGKRGVEFPSDREKVKGEHPGRHPTSAADRAQRVARAIPQGENERRGGHDRPERKHRSVVSQAQRRG